VLGDPFQLKIELFALLNDIPNAGADLGYLLIVLGPLLMLVLFLTEHNYLLQLSFAVNLGDYVFSKAPRDDKEALWNTLQCLQEKFLAV